MGDDIFDLDEDNSAPQLYDNISRLKPSMPWLDELNTEQRQAVETTEGPLLVLSGAGTGKTKVLTTRLAYILANGKANPWNCLVVTFTNRAANEMRERVQMLIGDTVNSVWLGTFHRICVKILRNHAELAGLKPNFTILGEDDQKRLIKQVLENENIDDKKYPPQSLMEQISRLKDKGISAERAAKEFRPSILLKVYQKYQVRLRELNCVDFGDILLDTLNLLMSDSEILTSYQDKFRYIMVDEYQDTNVTQYLLLRLLAQKHRNICCVGDDDQSIYSWRGAEIENIMRFQKDYEDAQIIRLEKNYRSTANILNAASVLIAHNETRLGKTLKVADNSPAAQYANSKIEVLSIASGAEEASWVAAEIEKLHRGGCDYSGIAILVRTAFQTREFEEKFINESIPYQVIGGPKFYERAEIRDILAYLRVVMQTDDDLALERIINKPARGIGAKTVEKIRTAAYERQTSMFDALHWLLEHNEFSGKTGANLSDLAAKFAEWRKMVNFSSPADLTEQVLEESGYMEMLKNDTSAESPGRIENLNELINVLHDTETYPSLADFLEHVSLVMENDSSISSHKVTLITLHSAKGLEFDVVFLPGWEEGLFPHQKSLDEGGGNSLEEERRLAYVAITRAKFKLYITTAFSRRIYGQWQTNQPSRFINELPSECLKIANFAEQYYSGGTNYEPSSPNGYYRRKYQDDFAPKQSAPKYKNYTGNRHSYSYEPVEENYSQPASSYIGIRVYHETFGYGKIIAVAGQTCVVKFDKYGTKKVMGTYLTKA